MGKISGLMVVTVGDKYSVSKINLGEEITTLNQASISIPEGVYTTFRTYNCNKMLRFNDHILRLEHSAKLVNFETMINKPNLRTILRDLLRNQQTDLRVRISLCLHEQPETIYLLSEPIIPLVSYAYLNGVKAVTCQLSRENPKAKLTDFINKSILLPKGVNEAIMVDKEGYLLEGLSSNFFAVKRGTIFTEEKKVLSGITRSIVLEEIRKSAIPFSLKAVNINELYSIDETFITSSSREVLPVSVINEEKIGLDVPGAITKFLMSQYHNQMLQELEII